MEKPFLESGSFESNVVHDKVRALLPLLDESSSASCPLPLEHFRGLPAEIQLCRLVLLGSNFSAPLEKHFNSQQTLFSFGGSGRLWYLQKGIFSNKKLDNPSLWHCLPKNTWHRPQSGPETWVTLAFHTASSEGIVDLTLRHPDPTEALLLSRVHIQSWQETYTGIMPAQYLNNLEEIEGESRLKMWQGRLTHPQERERIWIATRNQIPVGFVMTGAARDKDSQGKGEIFAIYLLRSSQKLGLGKALLQAGFSSLLNEGLDSASLWVAESNPTRGFYEKMGGQIQARKVDTCGAAKGISQVRYFWPDLQKSLGSISHMFNEA